VLNHSSYAKNIESGLRNPSMHPDAVLLTVSITQCLSVSNKWG